MAVWKLEQHVITSALLLSAMTLVVDYMTGPYVRFPIMFVLPVLIVSWYRGWPLSLGLALVLTTVRFGLAWHGTPVMLWRLTEEIVNVLIYLVVLSILAYVTAAAAQERRVLQEQVRVLRGILPICSFCKQIRDHEGQWQMLEAYIMHHSEAVFSHSVCPRCAEEHYGDYFKPQDEPSQTR